MAKLLKLFSDGKEELCLVGKALSSPTRIDIINLLSSNSFNIGEIAEILRIPASSAAMHIRVLEEAGLLNVEIQPGERGSMKLCSRKHDYLSITLMGKPTEFNETINFTMPIGAYTDCHVLPTCGLATAKESIGMDDQPSSFYLPERINAQILWISGGYLEYKFPRTIRGHLIKQLAISMEICSEAPNFREDWKSDISLWVNDVDCGTWTSPGDFGSRRGRITPSWWNDGNTQYGLLTTWSISEKGISINGQKIESKGNILSDIPFEKDFISVKIGNKPDAKYAGGFNIFGEKFGDYPQDIVLTIVY